MSDIDRIAGWFIERARLGVVSPSTTLTSLLEDYQGRRIGDVFQGSVRKGALGEPLTIENFAPINLSFPSAKSAEQAFLSELRLVFGIGHMHDQQLQKNGYTTIPSLLDHPRWKEAASTLLAYWGRPLDPNLVYKTLYYWLPSRHPLFLQLVSLVPQERLLFFDLETLGLGGTPIILAALAQLNAEGIRITQYLARSLDEEPALLDQIAQVIAETSLLISYNGKAFDWTYLRERFAYYGLQFTHAPMHIDLLHHARRAFHDCLPNMRLSMLEGHLGIQRTEDLPSEAVPEFYSTYLETGNPGPLVPIVNHNRQDVQTLALLLGHLLSHLDDAR